MTNLDERFRLADEIPVEDGWEEIQARDLGGWGSRSVGIAGARRWITLVVALAIGASAVAAVAVAFRGTSSQAPGGSSSPIPRSNGPIWALGGGGEVGTLIYSIDATTGQKSPLWTDERNPDFPNFRVAPRLVSAHYDYAFSPDGSRVAFSAYVHEGPGNCCPTELFVMNADGTGLTQVTHDDAYDSYPSWSPDGSTLVYASYRGPDYIPGCPVTKNCPADLYVIGADGTGDRRLTDDAADEATPTWSPDGTKIAYVFAEAGSPGAVWVMNADGTDARNLVPPDGGLILFPQWSPDGRRILYLSARLGERFGVWVATADGTDPHQGIDTHADTNFARNAVWSPDGTEIAFAKLADGEPELWVANADGRGEQQLATLPRYGISPLAWQPGAAVQASPAPGSGASPRLRRPAHLPCDPRPVAPDITLVTAPHNPSLAATCFAVSANTPFQLIIKDNTTALSDGSPVPVQFVIFRSKKAAVTFHPKYAAYSVNTARALFVGDVDRGGIATDNVKGLPAGTYYVEDIMFSAYQGASFWLIVE